MAELHRRIRGIPHRWLTAWASVAILAAPGAASGQSHDPLDATAEELGRAAERLASEDAAVRDRAIAALGSLEESSLPGIRARIATYRRPRYHSDTAYRALNAFRNAVGSSRADDRNVDVAPGIPIVLAQDRSRVTVVMAERRLILRSLLGIGTVEAGELIAEVIASDANAWRWEARRVVWTLGARALPTLLLVREHRDTEVRRWARWGIRELGLRSPGRAVQQQDYEVLADVLRAYGRTTDLEAMPVVVSFITHDRRDVREAARWATEQYGRNAIWQLRRAHRNFLGEEPNASWGHSRIAAAIYAAHDEQRLAPVRADLEAGLAAMRDGNLGTMRARFDDVLLRAPDMPRRAEMAPGYALLGERALTTGNLAEAARFYGRASALSANGIDAPRYEAALAFVEAERRRAAGVVDVAAYERVRMLDPSSERAERVLASLGRSEPGADARRRWLLAFAAFVLGLGGALAVRWRRRPAQDPIDEEEPPSIDTAPDTLPG